MLRTNIRNLVRQTQLPKWKPLLPVFEAVMNSFQAIEAARNFKRSLKGQIKIEIKREHGFLPDDARSQYGIVFKKDIAIHRGANPIMYAYKTHDTAAAFKKIIAGAMDKPNHPIWRITPFIDAPGSYGNSKYFFEWEREWRKVGDFKFHTDEVEFLIIPANLHKTARSFFKTAKTENLGPCYSCPFIDPHWNRKKIKSVLLEYAS